MHLSTEADCLDGIRLQLSLPHHAANGLNRCTPPVFRILFGPARFGLVERILGNRFSENFSCDINRECFGSTCTDVNSKVALHLSFSPASFYESLGEL